MKTKNISKEEELSFLVFKSTIQLELGRMKEALELAEKILGEIKETDSVLLRIDALHLKGTAHFNYTENVDESLNSINEGIELLETNKSVIPEKELVKRKALLFLIKGFLLGMSGIPKECQKLFEESISFARKSEDKRTLAWVLLWVGYVIVGLFRTSNDTYSEEALAISIEIGNKFLIALTYHSLAVIAVTKYDYYEAIELIENSFALLDKIGSTFYKEDSYNNLGVCYLATYQLDKALECYQRALKKGKIQKYLNLANIANIHLLNNELVKAKDYYLQALLFSEEVKAYAYLPHYLSRLIFISLELKEFAQAQKHLDRLKQLSKETGTEDFSLNAHFASILILKASGDISDLSEAVRLLKEILTKEDLSSYWRLEALYSLLEIRIKELQISATKDALAEVKKQAIRLEVEAEEKKYQWLLVNVYRLQSQLALVEMDVETAFDFLDKAETIAIETKNDFLKEKINDDREKINQQIDMIQNLQARKAPISEAIKLTSLENTIQTIKEDTVLEERDKESGKVIEYRKLFVLKL